MNEQMCAKLRRNQKNRASLKYLPQLFAEQQGLCLWCKNACAMLRFLPMESIIEQTADIVTWRDGELCFTARIASLDHLEPARDGGSDHPDNLVMACTKCNNDRTPSISPTPGPLRRVCPDCQRHKPERHTRCKDCQVNRAIGWIVGNGWEHVVREGRESAFRDPTTGEIHLLKHAARIIGERLRGDASRKEWTKL